MFGELLNDMDLDGDTLEPLRADLIRGEHARASVALMRQQQLAEAEGRIQRAHVEGLGELQMRVDPGVYFSMQLLHGIDCWKDAGFRSHMLQKNPGMRIKSIARKPTLRVQGLRDSSAGIRTVVH